MNVFAKHFTDKAIYIGSGPKPMYPNVKLSEAKRLVKRSRTHIAFHGECYCVRCYIDMQMGMRLKA